MPGQRRGEQALEQRFLRSLGDLIDEGAMLAAEAAEDYTLLDAVEAGLQRLGSTAATLRLDHVARAIETAIRDCAEGPEQAVAAIEALTDACLPYLRQESIFPSVFVLAEPHVAQAMEPHAMDGALPVQFASSLHVLVHRMLRRSALAVAAPIGLAESVASALHHRFGGKVPPVVAYAEEPGQATVDARLAAARAGIAAVLSPPATLPRLLQAILELTPKPPADRAGRLLAFCRDPGTVGLLDRTLRREGLDLAIHDDPEVFMRSSLAVPPDLVLVDAGTDPGQALLLVRALRAAHGAGAPLLALLGPAARDISRLASAAEVPTLPAATDPEELLLGTRRLLSLGRRLARTRTLDPRTGALLPMPWLAAADRLVRRARRQGVSLAICLARIEGLDTTDQPGERAALASRAVDVIRTRFRSTDVVGRPAHDVIGALLWNCTTLQTLDRLRDAISDFGGSSGAGSPLLRAAVGDTVDSGRQVLREVEIALAEAAVTGHRLVTA